VAINGNPVPLKNFPEQIKAKLVGKKKAEDRVVVVKSKPDTAYNHWIKMSSIIEDAGGIITLQIQEEEEITIPN
jgi:biopolymer transport protein ExbD